MACAVVPASGNAVTPSVTRTTSVTGAGGGGGGAGGLVVRSPHAAASTDTKPIVSNPGHVVRDSAAPIHIIRIVRISISVSLSQVCRQALLTRQNYRLPSQHS